MSKKQQAEYEFWKGVSDEYWASLDHLTNVLTSLEEHGETRVGEMFLNTTKVQGALIVNAMPEKVRDRIGQEVEAKFQAEVEERLMEMLTSLGAGDEQAAFDINDIFAGLGEGDDETVEPEEADARA